MLRRPDSRRRPMPRWLPHLPALSTSPHPDRTPPHDLRSGGSVSNSRSTAADDRAPDPSCQVPLRRTSRVPSPWRSTARSALGGAAADMEAQTALQAPGWRVDTEDLRRATPVEPSSLPECRGGPDPTSADLGSNASGRALCGRQRASRDRLRTPVRSNETSPAIRGHVAHREALHRSGRASAHHQSSGSRSETPHR